jgi:hypothetical protein
VGARSNDRLRQTNPDRQLRNLKIVVRALTAVPVLSGLTGIAAGPSALPGDRSAFDPTADSEYRFTNAVWLVIAPLIWSALRNAEYQTSQLRIIGGGIILGGLARLRSWRQTGRPHPLMLAAIALELVGIPSLLAWHTRIVRITAQRRQTPRGQ